MLSSSCCRNCCNFAPASSSFTDEGGCSWRAGFAYEFAAWSILCSPCMRQCPLRKQTLCCSWLPVCQPPIQDSCAVIIMLNLTSRLQVQEVGTLDFELEGRGPQALALAYQRQDAERAIEASVVWLVSVWYLNYAHLKDLRVRLPSGFNV